MDLIASLLRRLGALLAPQPEPRPVPVPAPVRVRKG